MAKANEIQLATVSPKVTRSIKAVQKYASEMTEIKSTGDMDVAAEHVKDIHILKKSLEEQRTSFTKPLNESLRNINSFFKKFSEPLAQADASIRQAMEKFHAEKAPEISQHGEAHFRKQLSIEVVDQSKVPAKYLEVNMMAVKSAIADGVIAIPGLKITLEEKVSL
jgi:phenylalanyl-tRNA synthetase alpha subunit